MATVTAPCLPAPSDEELLRRHAPPDVARWSETHGINLLINTQHETGGWRYGPQKSPGDLSISGWQIMAIKSAQMAGLDVPAIVSTRAKAFLQACSNSSAAAYTGASARLRR